MKLLLSAVESDSILSRIQKCRSATPAAISSNLRLAGQVQRGLLSRSVSDLLQIELPVLSTQTNNVMPMFGTALSNPLTYFTHRTKAFDISIVDIDTCMWDLTRENPDICFVLGPVVALRPEINSPPRGAVDLNPYRSLFALTEDSGDFVSAQRWNRDVRARLSGAGSIVRYWSIYNSHFSLGDFAQ